MDYHENVGPNMNVSPESMGPTNVSPSNMGPSNVSPAHMAANNMPPMGVSPAHMGPHMCPPPPMPMCYPHGISPAHMGPNMPMGISPSNISPLDHKRRMHDLCHQHIGKKVKLKTIFGDEFGAHIQSVDAENVYFIPIDIETHNDDDRWWGGFGFRRFWPLLWLGGLGGWWW